MYHVATRQNSTDDNRRRHVAKQTWPGIPPARQAACRGASASRLYDILDNGPRPCGGWRIPAGTLFIQRLACRTISASAGLLVLVDIVFGRLKTGGS